MDPFHPSCNHNFQRTGIHLSNYPRLANEADDTGRIQRAMNDASTNGAGLKIPPGTYTIHGELTWTASSSSAPILIDAEPGAVFDGTESPGRQLITLSGCRSTSSTALSESLNKGSLSMTTATAMPLHPGDILLITSTDLWNQARLYYYKGEMVQVESLSETTIHLKDQLMDSYHNETTVVYRLTMPRVIVRNLEIKRNSDTAGLGVQYARDVLLDGIKVSGARERGVECYYIFGGEITNCYVTDCWYPGTGTSYGIVVASSQNIAARNNRIFGGRHAMTYGGEEPCRHILVDGNVLDSYHPSMQQALDFHGNAEFVTVTNNHILNGFNYSGRNLMCVNNTIIGNTAGGVYWSGEVDSDYLIVKGNFIDASSGPHPAIIIQPYAPNVAVETFDISHNHVRSANHGICVKPQTRFMTGFTVNNFAIKDNDVLSGLNESGRAIEVVNNERTAMSIASLTVEGGRYASRNDDVIYIEATGANVFVRNASLCAGRTDAHGICVTSANDVDVSRCYIDSAAGSNCMFQNTGVLRMFENIFRNISNSGGIRVNGPALTMERDNVFKNCSASVSIEGPVVTQSFQQPATLSTGEAAEPAGLLPVSPAGYVQIQVNGTMYKMPYFNA